MQVESRLQVKNHHAQNKKSQKQSVGFSSNYLGLNENQTQNKQRQAGLATTLTLNHNRSQIKNKQRQSLNFGWATKEMLNKVYLVIVGHGHQPLRYMTKEGPLPNNAYGYVAEKLDCYASYPSRAVLERGAPVSQTWTTSLIKVVKDYGRLQGGNNFEEARNRKTKYGNPMLELVPMPGRHSLTGYIASGKPGEDVDTVLQIEMNKRSLRKTFAGEPAKVLFPTEMAVSEQLIPAVVAAGIEAILIENSHKNRTNADCPENGEQVHQVGNHPNFQEFNDKAQHKGPNPNKADMRNPAAGTYLAPKSKDGSTPPTSASSLRPHWVEYVDPHTGKSTKILGIPVDTGVSPCSQHGAPEPGLYMVDQYKKHLGIGETKEGELPATIVLASDSDNYGSVGDRYWMSTKGAFNSAPDVVEMITLTDYLTIFKDEIAAAKDNTPAQHVEPGAWEGAAVDPQFAKVSNTDERWTKSANWKEIFAAKNYALLANSLEPHTPGDQGLDNLEDFTGSDTDRSLAHLLLSETSCFTYFEGFEEPYNEYRNNVIYSAANTRKFADNVIDRHKNEPGFDKTGPTVSMPLRYDINGNRNARNWNSWNPGKEGFMVSSWAHDYSGIPQGGVKLKVRKVNVKDGVELGKDKALLTYEGKPGVTSEWQDLEMIPKAVGYDKKETEMKECPPQHSEALRYDGQINEDVIAGFMGETEEGVMLQYYVTAQDGAEKPNTTDSPITSVWIDNESKSSGASSVTSVIPIESENADEFKVGFSGVDSDNKVAHLWGSGEQWGQYVTALKKAKPELVGSDGKSVDIPLTAGTTTDKKGRQKKMAVLAIPNKEILKDQKVSYMFRTGPNGWDNGSIRENGLEIK